MAAASSTPFRFRDLPSELRSKIYRNLLCEFAPPQKIFDTTDMFEHERVCHDTETAILRASKETYREAYDIMVKTNRFVKLTSVQGLPLQALMKGMRVPVVSSAEDIVKSFKGYVLAVDFKSRKPLRASHTQEDPFSTGPLTVMILHRDLDIFCQALTDGDAYASGFSNTLKISITMAPILDDRRASKIGPTFDKFFSTKTQEALLAPFRARLHGYKTVEIKGHVDSALATTLREDMAREQWSEPESIIAEFSAAKENGSRLFREQKREQACLAWLDAAVDIDKIIESSSWPALVRVGGERFISQLAPIYFLIRLNIAHVQIADMQQSSQFGEYAGLMIEDSLHCAVRALKKGFWMKDYKYTPSNQHLAKLRYRFATFMRLQAEPGTADRALTYIEAALRLQPGDAAILRERDNILAWKQQM